MAHFRIGTQNIGGIGLGGGSNKNKLCPLKLYLHKNKPSIMVLTETRHLDSDKIDNAFKGYKVSQAYSTGSRSGGIIVYTRKDIAFDNNVNIQTRHYTIGIYTIQGTRIIVSGIYGPSCNSDTTATAVYRQFSTDYENIAKIGQTAYSVITGDLNLHLDTLQPKPRACKFVRDFISINNFCDSGKAGGKATWRRPNRMYNRSRIDYILHSANFKAQELQLSWSQLNHALIDIQLTIGEVNFKRKTLKDWVLMEPSFLVQGSQIIRHTLIDHSQHWQLTDQERHEVFEDIANTDIEEGLIVKDEMNGITNAHVVMIIIQRTQSLHRRTQKQLEEKSQEKLRRVQSEIQDSLARLDREQNEEIRAEIEDSIEDLKQTLAQEAETIDQRNRQRIENFYKDKMGKQTAESYSIIKESKRNGITKLEINDIEINEQKEINNILRDDYMTKVGEVFTPEMRLQDFLQKYQIQLETLPEEDRDKLEEEITRDEITAALKNKNKNSAPGPSGQTAGFYKYIMSQMPGIFTKTINELAFVPGLQTSSCFKWIKDRHIVYIPKPGKSPHKTENIRPLSMLESLYKIITRILSNRLISTLDQIVSKNQHGFVPKRLPQNCSLPIIEAINDAQRHGKPLQLLTIDIKAAFDSISPEHIKETMQIQKYPNMYIETLHNITADGTGRVLTRNYIGTSFQIKSGSGQGDPPSAPRYNIGADPVLVAVQAVMHRYAYTFSNGYKLPIFAFADDQFCGTNAKNAREIRQIISVYEDFGKVSGLKINIKKTKMICINTPQKLQDEITNTTGIKIVSGFRHLGIEIRDTLENISSDTYEAIKAKISTKMDYIRNSFVDLFHKRQLIMHVIIPSYIHVYMAIGYNNKAGVEQDTEIRKLLWTKKVEGEVKNKRHLVAKERIEAGFEYGGLQIDRAEVTAESMAVNTMQRIYTQLKNNKDLTFIATYYEAITRELMGVSITEMFQNGGYQCWKALQNRCKNKAHYLSFMAGSMAKLHYMNENSAGKLSAMIAGNSNITLNSSITIIESITLQHHGITFCNQLFGINELTGRIDLATDREYPVALTERHKRTVEKCKQLRVKLASKTTNAINTATAWSIITILENTKMSKINRKLNREIINSRLEGPPSYKTRRRDRYALPALHKYMEGYINIVKLDIPSKTREISFNIMNRTCWTNQKRYWSSQRANNTGVESSKRCSLCGKDETTQHLIFECQEYSEGLWENMSKVITELSGKHFQIHMFHVMYNIKIIGIEERLAKIVHVWIQEVKRYIVYKRYLRETKISLRNIIYDKDRIISHLIIVMNKLKSLKQFQKTDTTMLDKIFETLKRI